MICSDFNDTAPIDMLDAGSCPGSNFYIVQTGDTLYAISRFYNISLDDLITANPFLDPDSITPGQEIFIPLAVSSASCPPGAVSYIVQKGDTFYTIAKKVKMSLSTLLKANPNVNPDALLVGQSICIPRISSSYINESYGIKFMYPYRWSKINDCRYEGVDGFFQVSALFSYAFLKEICSSEAYHKLKPYGTHPSIISAQAAGLEACFITPSSDQPMEMRSQSALILNYGRLMKIGGTGYNYLIIRTDISHLKSIADTLEFLGE